MKFRGAFPMSSVWESLSIASYSLHTIYKYLQQYMHEKCVVTKCKNRIGKEAGLPTLIRECRSIARMSDMLQVFLSCSLQFLRFYQQCESYASWVGFIEIEHIDLYILYSGLNFMRQGGLGHCPECKKILLKSNIISQLCRWI